MDYLLKLASIAESKSLISNFSQEVDESLDQRESLPFDQHWSDNYKTLKSLTEQIEGEEMALVNIIREAAFKNAYRKTNNPDVSAYVSDDFELLCWAILNRSSNGWLNSILRIYLNGGFPCGEIVELQESLEYQLDHRQT